MAIDGLPDVATVEKMIPLRLVLSNRSDSGQTVRLDRIEVASPLADLVEVNQDLFDRSTPIRPGETVALYLPLNPVKTGQADLALLTLWLRVGEGAAPVAVRLPSRPLAVTSNLEAEIECELVPRVRYSDTGTRCRLSLWPKGSADWHDLTLAFTTPLVSGPQVVRRLTFRGDDRIDLEIVTSDPTLTLTLEATNAHGRSRAVRRFDVPAPEAAQRQRFVFLQPRALTSPKIELHQQLDSQPSRLIRANRQGAYHLDGRAKYELVIHPGIGGQRVRVSEIPQALAVRQQSKEDGAWRFLLETTGHRQFRHRETLYFTIEGDHPTEGQIPLVITPVWSSRALTAGAIGGALMIQGVLALGALLYRGAPAEEYLAGFTFGGDMNWWRLLSAPLIFLGYYVGDGVLDRLEE